MRESFKEKSNKNCSVFRRLLLLSTKKNPNPKTAKSGGVPHKEGESESLRLVVGGPGGVAPGHAHGALAHLVVGAVAVHHARESLALNGSAQPSVAPLVQAALRVGGALEGNGGASGAAVRVIAHLVHWALAVRVAPVAASRALAVSGGAAVVSGVVGVVGVGARGHAAGAVHAGSRGGAADLRVATLVIGLALLGLAQTLDARFGQEALVVVPARVERASVQALSSLAALAVIVLALLVDSALRVSIAPVGASRWVRRVQRLTASSQARLVGIAISVSRAAPRAGNAIASSAFLGPTTVVVHAAGTLRGSHSTTRFQANASDTGLVEVADVQGIGVHRVGVVVGIAIAHRDISIAVVGVV